MTCTGNYRYFQICCFARKSNCTNARVGIAHLVQSCITLIDFLYRMCHTNVAGNVPDNVPETLSESEARRHGKPDHQGHRTDQRLLCQHHLPCDQRQAGCPPGDQGARSEGDAGGRVCAQHQRPTAEDSAVPQPCVCGKGTRNIFFSDFLVQLQRAATLYGYNGIVSYLDENANEIDAAERSCGRSSPKASSSWAAA